MRWLGLLLAAAPLPPLSAQHAPAVAAGDVPAATAVRTAERIRLDGFLDEPAWATATPIGELRQQEPDEGQPASEATEVRVLFDADHLYFGIVCHDREPAAIVTSQLSRDAELETDDYVLVAIDPFLDRRNGFVFQTNAAGARADGQISNNQERLSYEWDGIWDVRARVTPAGWTLELAIPFKTLRFEPGQTTWGLNVQRQVKRRQEIDRWASPRRDVWITNLSRAGELLGLEGIRQGRGLDIRPYVSGGREESDGQFRAGLDVFKNLTSSLNASLTINTDFAETEVDERQVNLTRFPLFFPEKRAFFLEGAGTYEIAGLGGRNRDVIPFFSRRIGLLEGEEVPIELGAKFAGRAGGFNIGALDVETKASKNGAVGGQNLAALRVSRNLLEQSWVGVIATRGNPEGTGDNNLLGADLRLATSRFNGSQNLSLDLWAFRTDDAERRAVDRAWGFKLDYPNDLFDVALNWKRIGDDFQPALGFLPRAGIQKSNLSFNYMPRPRGLGIRQLFVSFDVERIANLRGRVENWRVDVMPVRVQLESGDVLAASLAPTFERLPESFEIQPGIVLPAGSYRWTRRHVGFTTADKRAWVVDAAYLWGSFYDGRLSQIETFVTLKPSAHFNLELGLERNDAELRAGHFVTNVLAAGVSYNASANLAWSNVVQYDSESRVLGVQSRLRWTLQPGNDVFLVVNRGWLRAADGSYLPRFERGSAKLQYTIRL